MDKIADILNSVKDLHIFVQILNLTGIFKELSGERLFTVFAPDNDAFNKIPFRRLIKIMANTEFMRDLIHYHIVPGEYDSKILSLKKNLKTLLGSELDIKSKSKILHSLLDQSAQKKKHTLKLRK